MTVERIDQVTGLSIPESAEKIWPLVVAHGKAAGEMVVQMDSMVRHLDLIIKNRDSIKGLTPENLDQLLSNRQQLNRAKMILEGRSHGSGGSDN